MATTSSTWPSEIVRLRSDQPPNAQTNFLPF